MSHLKQYACGALLLCAAALPAAAASSAASSASDAASSTVGSLSTSLRGSSDSSRATVAQGEYRILDVADLGERPGFVRLNLQALADDSDAGRLQLDLPRVAVEQSGLDAGHTVLARARPYGVEFANARTQQAFFLALADAWYRDLQTHPVTL